ncbi:site-specific integrase [Burkholderia vietnamiensis]
MFAPTVFTLSEVRGRNLATSTIGIVLRSVMAFHLFLDARGIDLDARLTKGELLSLAEVEDLSRLCRRTIVALAALSKMDERTTSNVLSLESVRMVTRKAPSIEVRPDVAAGRLRYIRMYLQWLTNERRSRYDLPTAVGARLGEASTFVIDAINVRIPSKSGRNIFDQRAGLPGDVEAELLRVIDPESPANPWRHPHVRYRNAALIHWLLYLGVRIGEALGVRVSDIDFRLKQVTIHRQADSLDDPRTYQPQTKTRPRVFPVSNALLAETQTYILKYRSNFPQAKKHPFLFVADRTGRPMALATISKVFRVLRARCPDLPEHLCAHLLRHTWNDTFSAMASDRGMSHADECQARSYLMGWSPTSKSAATYTRRFVRQKANEVSLGLQNQIVNKAEHDE